MSEAFMLIVYIWITLCLFQIKTERERDKKYSMSLNRRESELDKWVHFHWKSCVVNEIVCPSAQCVLCVKALLCTTQHNARIHINSLKRKFKLETSKGKFLFIHSRTHKREADRAKQSQAIPNKKRSEKKNKME